MARQTAIVCIAAVGMTIVIVVGRDRSLGRLDDRALHRGHRAVAAAERQPALRRAGGDCDRGALRAGQRRADYAAPRGAFHRDAGDDAGHSRGRERPGEERRIEAPATWLNDLLRVPRAATLLPSGIWAVIVLAILVAALLRYTRFGRHVFAIGSNERMARLCGVAITGRRSSSTRCPPRSSGFAGLLQFSKLSVGDPTVAVGLELDVIAAVIIGGGSLSGGRGTVAGTLIGAAIMTIIQIGCSQKDLRTGSSRSSPAGSSSPR